MKKEHKIIDALSFMIYAVSPIASLFTAIIGIIKNTRFGHIFFSLAIAFMSFSFIPMWNWDKSRHLELYEIVKNYSLQQFLDYNFSESPDFIFRGLLYLGASSGISAHIIVFFITFWIVYYVMIVFRDYRTQRIDSNILYPLLTMVSLSYMDIFSGLRYTLAISFVFYAYYVGLIKRQNTMAIIFLLLGIFTHFSVVLFAVIYVFFPHLNKISFSKSKIILLLSCIFFIIREGTIFSLFQALGLSGSLDLKVNAYLSEERLQQDITGFAATFIFLSNVIWIYLTFIVVFLEKFSYNQYARILLWLLVFINIFYAFPIIYNRYALFLKFFIVLYVIEIRSRRLQLIYFVLFSMMMLNNLIVMRYGLLDILSNPNKWLLIYQILENNFTSQDSFCLVR